MFDYQICFSNLVHQHSNCYSIYTWKSWVSVSQIKQSSLSQPKLPSSFFARQKQVYFNNFQSQLLVYIVRILFQKMGLTLSFCFPCNVPLFMLFFFLSLKFWMLMMSCYVMLWSKLVPNLLFIWLRCWCKFIVYSVIMI